METQITLENRIPEIQYIAPVNTKGVFGGEAAQGVRGLKSNSYPVYGYFPVIAKMATQKIYDNGRFINDEDDEQARKVCVIGERTEQELFEKDEDPIGGYIRIDGIYFQVVGVHKFTQTTPFGTDGDIYIPFSTFQKLYNTADNAQYFTIAAYDDADVVQVEKDIKSVLKSIHKVHPDDERAFGAFNLGEIFSKIMGFAKRTNLCITDRWPCYHFSRSNRDWKHSFDICKRTYQRIRNTPGFRCHS